jgi:hypothetical protein
MVSASEATGNDMARSEQDLFARLEQAIMATTEGFCDGEELLRDLRVTLRIVADVQKFMVQAIDPPDPSELSYVMGTIQSGVDEFFLVGHVCRSFKDLEESWTPERQSWRTFTDIKVVFLDHLDVVIGEPSSPVERVGSLLSLMQIQLALLSRYFPWGEARHVDS